jgi:hypothetical protein
MRWLFALLLLTACDDLNRPMGHPKSPSLTPESSSSSTGGMPSSSSDAGATSPEGGPATAPTVTAQPGDIQI